MNDKTGQIDWDMAARILAGEGDEIDRGLLESWLAQSDANRQEWEAIEAAWSVGGEALLLEKINTHAAWERLQHETVLATPARKVLTPSRSLMMAIAAVLVITLGLVWLFSRPSVQPSSSLIVSNTETEEVALSDGSLVTLNVGSKFSCPQPFNMDERKVQLKGEGFFKVEGDANWPFVVETGNLTVRVTGTEFNVRAYPHLNMEEVYVVKGEVEVMTSAATPDKVMLHTGQMALFQQDNGMLEVHEESDVNFLAWLTRQLKFNETSLQKVFETLGRVYNVNIQVTDSSIASEKLTAQFSDNSLDFVLNVVCRTFNLKMEREGNTIVLTREKPYPDALPGRGNYKPG